MLLAKSLFDYEFLTPIALFGMVFALAWWVLDRIASGRPRALERLAELREPERQQRRLALKKNDAVSKVLEAVSYTHLTLPTIYSV